MVFFTKTVFFTLKDEDKEWGETEENYYYMIFVVFFSHEFSVNICFKKEKKIL